MTQRPFLNPDGTLRLAGRPATGQRDGKRLPLAVQSWFCGGSCPEALAGTPGRRDSLAEFRSVKSAERRS